MNLRVVPDESEEPVEKTVPKYSLNDIMHMAPQSLLVIALFGMTALLGGLANEVRSGMSKEQQRLEAAINDAPSKYQARLSERVAVVETETAGLKRAVEANTSQTAKLTVQVELLTAEIRRAK